MKRSYLTNIFFVSIAWLFCNAAFADTKVSIPMAEDLFNLKNTEPSKRKVILLYIAAQDCPYCKRLEKEIIRPMLRNPSYHDLVKLFKVNLNSTKKLVDFDGQIISSVNFAAGRNAKVTPSLLFLSPSGEELTARLVGYQGSEFYWYQLDNQIELASARLNAKNNN